ncbi:MAG: DUF6089 family protein [Ginsengibacter sp.]
MKSKLFIFLFLCVISLHSKGQFYFYNDEFYDNAVTFEAGLSVGPMNSLTDVGGRKGKGTSGAKDLNMNSTTLFGSIYVSAIYRHSFGLRLEGTLGRVQSNDSLLAGVKNTAIGRYNRNLSFRSPIAEVALIAEFHPLDFINQFKPEPSSASLSPYLLAGVGFFHFNPQASLNGRWIDLQPLHTEGEGFAEYPDRLNYKLNQFNIPFGIGLAYEVSPKVKVRVEYINRKLSTDYLDDVHSTYIDPSLFSKYLSGTKLQQALILNNRGRPEALPSETTATPGSRRGNPKDNDSYFTLNFKVGIVFGRKRISSDNKFSRRQYSSPTRF